MTATKPPSDMATLQRAIEAWLKYRKLEGDHHFYSPEAWCARKEGIGECASLTLITEGPLYRAMNGWTKKCNAIQEELRRLLERHGYYYDMGYRWSLHFYPEYPEKHATELPAATFEPGKVPF